MFEGDSADMCAGKFPLVSMGGRAEGLACADPGARTPIGTSGNLFVFLQFYYPFLSLKYMLTLHMFHNISLLPVQMNKYFMFMLFRILDFLKGVIRSMKYILLYILRDTNVYFSVNRLLVV